MVVPVPVRAAWPALNSLNARPVLPVRRQNPSQAHDVPPNARSKGVDVLETSEAGNLRGVCPHAVRDDFEKSERYFPDDQAS